MFDIGEIVELRQFVLKVSLLNRRLLVKCIHGMYIRSYNLIYNDFR